MLIKMKNIKLLYYRDNTIKESLEYLKLNVYVVNVKESAIEKKMFIRAIEKYIYS